MRWSSCPAWCPPACAGAVVEPAQHADSGRCLRGTDLPVTAHLATRGGRGSA